MTAQVTPMKLNAMQQALAGKKKLGQPEPEYWATVLALAFAKLPASVLAGPVWEHKDGTLYSASETYLYRESLRYGLYPAPWELCCHLGMQIGTKERRLALFVCPTRCLACGSWSRGDLPLAAECQECRKEVEGKWEPPERLLEVAAHAGNQLYKNLSRHWKRVFISEYAYVRGLQHGNCSNE